MTQRGTLYPSARARRFSMFLRGGIAGAGAVSIAAGVALGGSHGSGVASHQATLATPMRLAAAAPQSQYWMVASDGGIFSFGGAPFYGSTGNIHLAKPIVGMAATPDGGGYWFVASDGGIFTEGDAGFFGSHGGSPLNQPIVGMAATPDGGGYWLVARDGGIFTYGNAGYFGSTGAIKLNQPIVGMASTPDGLGYWLVAADGGIFTFGDAGYFGSTGAIRLNQPIVGMAASPSGLGYWLVARDGGIFSFGDAQFFGSTGAIKLNQPIVGMAATQTGQGYWFVASDGGIFSYGDAQFSGSMGGTRLAQPVVGMAGRPVLFPGSIALSLTSPTVTADGVSTVQITATVTDPGVAVPGDTLVFGVVTSGCGTLSKDSGVTNLAGQVTVTYTSSPGVLNCQIGVAEVFGPLTASTAVSQVAGAPAYLNATPSTDASYTADQGHTGIPATFTLSDSLGHAISGTQVNFSTNLSTCTVVPSSGTTDSNGSITVAVHDTTAADSCVVSGSVPGTQAAGNTGHFNITQGSVAALTVTTPSSPQVAGASYNLTVTAHDAYGNLSTPNPTAFVYSGTADSPSPSPNNTPATVHAGTFSNGQGTLTVTSALANSAAVFTVKDGTATASTNAFTINAGPAASIVASPKSTPPMTADTMASNGLPITFSVTDSYGNPAPNATVTVGGRTNFSHASPAVPATLPTGDGTGATTLGQATFVLHDTSIADTGQLSGSLASTPPASDSTGTITITPGLLNSLAWSGSSTTPNTAIPAQTAGHQFTVYLNAADHYGNPVNPPVANVAITGSALAPSPNGAPSSFSVGTFSGGQSAVSIDSTFAGSGRQIVATDATNTLGGATVTNSASYTVNPDAYAQLVATSPAFVQTDVGNGIFFQDPTAGALAQVTLTADDKWGNGPVTTVSDPVTVTLAKDSSSATTADSGTLSSGATMSAPDTATPAALPVSLSGGTAQFNYNVAGSIVLASLSSGNGVITFTDATPPAGLTYSPATTEVTVTKVHIVTVSVGQTSLTADQANGPGLTVTGTASTGSGTQLSMVPIDFSTSGTLMGTGLSQTAATPSSPGPVNVTMHPTKVTGASSTGSAIATLRGAPSTNVNLSSQSPVVTVTPGTLAVLTLGTTTTPVGASSPATPIAGGPFTMTLTATDAELNPVTPSGSFSPASGSTALATAPDGTDTGSIQSVNWTSTGQGTLTAVAVLAQTNAKLGITYGSVSSNLSTFNVVNDVAKMVTAGTLSSCCTADAGNSGFAVAYTVKDRFQNVVPSQTLQLTTGLTHATVDTSASPTKANSVAFPVNIVTNSSGQAGAKVYDTAAGDTGSVTVTVPQTTVTGAAGPITITAGALHTLAVSSIGNQTAGSPYTATVTATDTYGNAVQPAVTVGSSCTSSSTPIACSGPAVADHAPDGTGNAATWATTFGSNGVASLNVTSYKAEANVSLTVTDGTPTATSGTYTVASAPATQYLVTSANTDYNAATHTVNLSTTSETVAFTITMADAWQNVATTHPTDVINVSLSGTDGGSLTGGGQSTGADGPATTVAVNVTLSSGTGSFAYKGPGTPIPATSGTIHFSDTTAGTINPSPTSITVNG